MSASAVILLSGGLDSATVLALARARGYDCYALSVHYGQRHDAELRAAARVAQALGAREHRVMGVDLAGLTGSGVGGRIRKEDVLEAARTAEEAAAAIPEATRMLVALVSSGVAGVLSRWQ